MGGAIIQEEKLPHQQSKNRRRVGVWGKATLDALLAIASTPLVLIDIVATIAAAGYGASPARLATTHQRLHASHGSYSKEHAEELHRARMMLAYLRRSGLIEEKGTGKTHKIFLSALGKLRLKKLQQRFSTPVAHPPTSYTAAPGNRFVIVTFDVPEKERRKRDWLRNSLAHLGLQMIQKSVWVGKIKLPRQFLDDIQALHLVQCVEIFEVSKTGTLQHLL